MIGVANKDEVLIDMLAIVESTLGEDVIEQLTKLMQAVKDGRHQAVATIAANLPPNKIAEIVAAIAFLKANQAIEPNRVFCEIIGKIVKNHKEFFLPRFPGEMRELVKVIENDPEITFTCRIVLGVILGMQAKAFAERR